MTEVDADLVPMRACEIAESQVALARIAHELVLNTPADVILDQVRHNISRGLPDLTWQPARKRGEHTISLCGSAPSLKTTMGEITGKVMAFNAAIRALTEAGVRVDYPMIWDASPEMVRYACDIPGAEWLIASRCNPELIDRLLDMGQRVTLWHTAGEQAIEDVLGPGRLRVHGGSTAVQRGAFLAVFMGFYDLHVFGADSSLSDDGETHVGGALRDEKEIVIVVDGPNLSFRTTLWMQNQADEWQKFTLPTLVNSGISVTMHGHGLLPFVHHLWMERNGKVGTAA